MIFSHDPAHFVCVCVAARSMMCCHPVSANKQRHTHHKTQQELANRNVLFDTLIGSILKMLYLHEIAHVDAKKGKTLLGPKPGPNRVFRPQ